MGDRDTGSDTRHQSSGISGINTVRPGQAVDPIGFKSGVRWTNTKEARGRYGSGISTRQAASRGRAHTPKARGGGGTLHEAASRFSPRAKKAAVTTALLFVRNQIRRDKTR